MGSMDTNNANQNLDAFLQNFADWDRPGFDLALALQ